MAFEISVFTDRAIGASNVFNTNDGKYAFVGMFAAPFKTKKGDWRMGYSGVLVSLDDNGNPVQAHVKPLNILTADRIVPTKDGKQRKNTGDVIDNVMSLKGANLTMNANLFWFNVVLPAIGSKAFELKNEYFVNILDKSTSVFAVNFVGRNDLNLGNTVLRSTIEALVKPLEDAETLKLETAKASGEIPAAKKEDYFAKFYLFTPGETYAAAQ